MRTLRLIAVVCLTLALSSPLWARQRLNFYCQQGGVRPYVSNVGTTEIPPTSRTTFWVQSYPGATATVYLTGTNTLATIYSDNSGTLKANPFTTDAVTAFGSFYADDGRYDVRCSDSVAPVRFTAFTLGDYQLFDYATGTVANATTADTATHALNLPADFATQSAASPQAVYATKISNIRFATQFAGADACLKMQAAIDDLPSSGGEVIADFYGSQTCSVNPFANMPTDGSKAVLLVLGPATFNTTVQWIVGYDCWVIGSSRGQTRIKAANGFSASPSYVVRLGYADKLAFGTYLKHLAVDTNGLSGVGGVYSVAINERAGLEDVGIANIGSSATGIHIDGSVVTTTNEIAQTYVLRDLEIYFKAGVDASASLGIYINGGASGPELLENITVNGATTAIPPDKLFQITNVGQGVFTGIHVENGTNGFYFGPTNSIGFSMRGITGGPNMTTVINLPSTPGVTQGFRMDGIKRSTGVTNTILDVDHSQTITSQNVTEYVVVSGGLPHSIRANANFYGTQTFNNGLNALTAIKFNGSNLFTTDSGATLLGNANGTALVLTGDGGTHKVYLNGSSLNSGTLPINTSSGYSFNGTAGVSGTKTAGSCTFTIQGGIITNVTGC